MPAKGSPALSRERMKVRLPSSGLGRPACPMSVEMKVCSGAMRAKSAKAASFMAGNCGMAVPGPRTFYGSLSLKCKNIASLRRFHRPARCVILRHTLNTSSQSIGLLWKWSVIDRVGRPDAGSDDPPRVFPAEIFRQCFIR